MISGGWVPETRCEKENMMRNRLSIGLMSMILLLAANQSAWARAPEEEHEVVDARLEEYGRNVTLNGGTALTWILFVFLGGICVIGLFKDAKRSHLD